MWQGKKKAVTFSFDDGVTQDIRLIEMLDRYGLKATFNVNSELLGKSGSLVLGNKEVRHDKIAPERVREVYAGHEVAVHTLTHPLLPSLDEAEIIRQVDEDRKNLSALCGYEVVGMAYPCGGVNNDRRVAEIIRKNTPIAYARTITSTHAFALQDNLLQFHPTVYICERELEETVERFLATESDEAQLLYIWGHAYELDGDFAPWERLERVCQKLAHKADIFYGTNREVLLTNR